MLRNTELKLKDACDICCAAESSQYQLSEMRIQDTATPVSKVRTKNQVKCFQYNEFRHIPTKCSKGSHSANENKPQCFNCSGYGHKSRETAPVETAISVEEGDLLDKDAVVMDVEDTK